jgi:hypothetical protein
MQASYTDRIWCPGRVKIRFTPNDERDFARILPPRALMVLPFLGYFAHKDRFVSFDYTVSQIEISTKKRVLK